MKTVWLINDNEDDIKYEQRSILEALPDAKVESAESLYDMRERVSGPDILVIDISAIAPIAAGPYHCYGPICSFHEKFPGATIIICSAVSSAFALDVRDLVMDRCSSAIVKLVEWNKCDPYTSLRKLLVEA